MSKCKKLYFSIDKVCTSADNDSIETMGDTHMTREELTAEAGREFQSLLHIYNLCMQRTLRKYGLYPGQPQLLFAVRTLGTPTQNELAEHLSITKASVGVSLRRLENTGFIKRVRDKKDTRCIRITLTQKGQDYARWCDIDFEMFFTTLLENFSGDERADALDMLRRMNKSMQAFRERLDS